jgi:hypothetical protein
MRRITDVIREMIRVPIDRQGMVAVAGALFPK